MTRPPVDTIEAPPFPRGARWVGAPPARPEERDGRPLLVEFWDFCRPNSLRTLPYLRAWDERYRAAGLRIVGVHSPGFAPSADPDAVAAAVARFGIAYPVLVDSAMEVWSEYDNLGWPARYLFDGERRLFEYHFGEGAYAETERAIQELLGDGAPPIALLPPVRPEDDPEAMLAVQSDDVAGPYCGPYEAGAVWAVLSGVGRVFANGTEVTVDHPGAYELLTHPVSTAGVLQLEVGDSVDCHAVCFTPGLAP